MDFSRGVRFYTHKMGKVEVAQVKYFLWKSRDSTKAAEQRRLAPNFSDIDSISSIHNFMSKRFVFLLSE